MLTGNLLVAFIFICAGAMLVGRKLKHSREFTERYSSNSTDEYDCREGYWVVTHEGEIEEIS